MRRKKNRLQPRCIQDSLWLELCRSFWSTKVKRYHLTRQRQEMLQSSAVTWWVSRVSRVFVFFVGGGGREILYIFFCLRVAVFIFVFWICKFSGFLFFVLILHIPWFSGLVYLSASKSSIKTCFRCCPILPLTSKPVVKQWICYLLADRTFVREPCWKMSLKARPPSLKEAALARQIVWGTSPAAAHFLGPENGPKNGATLLNLIKRLLRKWLWFWGRPCQFLSSFARKFRRKNSWFNLAPIHFNLQSLSWGGSLGKSMKVNRVNMAVSGTGAKPSAYTEVDKQRWQIIILYIY